MNGKAHQKIAILSYAIVATIPSINSLPILNNSLVHIPRGISLGGLALAGLAALLVDADTPHSKINHINPAAALANDTIDLAGHLLNTIMRLILGVGFGLLIFKYSKLIINEISSIKPISHYASIITYLVALLFIFSGVASERSIKRIPIIGSMYGVFSSYISMGESVLKRIAMFVIYAGSGVFLMVYNIKHTNDIYLYLISFLLIAIAIFPHRSFLHSPEGLAVFSISVSYLLNKIGYGSLTGAFVVGYASHIYWADIFTKEGVPLFFTPRFICKILKRLGIDNEIEKILGKIGDVRLRLLPKITTGSKTGNIFEMAYILVLLVIAVISYRTYGGNFRII